MKNKPLHCCQVTVLLSCLALTALPGCGKSHSDVPSEPVRTVEDVPWKTEGFAAAGELTEEQAFWPGQYLPWERAGQADWTEVICQDSGACGELFWRLGTEAKAGETVTWDSGREYVLEVYDTVSGETMTKRFTPGNLGMEEEICELDSMDVLDRGHYVFRGMGYELDEEGVCRQVADRMIYTDLAGDIQTADFWEVYLEKGIAEERGADVPEEYKGLPLVQEIIWRCDKEGNVCVMEQGRDGGFKGFFLFDRNARVLLEQEGTAGQQFMEPLRTRDGELIFPVHDRGQSSYEFLWVNAAEGALRPLGQVEASRNGIRQVYGLLGEDVYYESLSGIVRWNVKDGRRVQVLDFNAAGISAGYETMLALRPGQTPVLRLTKSSGSRQKEWIAPLEDHEVPAGEVVRVANLTQAGEWSSGSVVAKCAVDASLVDPGVRYQYEEAMESRDRILAELSAGKGPDLLYVTPEDLYVLEEKGLLLDLEELIPKELREELLPGALGLGTVNGALKGVPAVVWAETLAVARDTWSQDTWRLEDVIGLMEEGKLEGAIYAPTLMNTYLPPAATVRKLVQYNLGSSFLIDWKNGKSHFDDERFLRLLKVTRTDLSKAPETEQYLNGGKNVVAVTLTHESFFNETFAFLEEEDGRFVGYPTEGGSGNYLETPGVLVVNANTAQKEAAANFLKVLLGEELQSKRSISYLSVRKLDPEKGVQEKGSGAAFYYGKEMAVFRDGTTAPQRAAAFLEGCVARPHVDAQVVNIYAEEMSATYGQGLPPEEAAGNLNRRIQLYLDEKGLH